MTKVFPCTCSNQYQDNKYGKGNRVHNSTVEPKPREGWRCTSCGKEFTR